MIKLRERFKIISSGKGIFSKILIFAYFFAAALKVAHPEKILFKDILVFKDRGILFKIRKNMPTDLWISSPSYDKNVFDIINKMTIRNFIDIGANKGAYTIKLARRSEKVLAIEPDELNFKCLSNNVLINKFDNVILKKMGCFNKKGKAKLSIHPFNEGAHSLLYKRSSKDEEIKIDLLDNIIKEEKFEHVDLIKIDVEGVEAEVLEGAKDLIKREHPKIIFEATDETKLKEVKKVLNRFDYKIKHIDDSNYLAF